VPVLPGSQAPAPPDAGHGPLVTRIRVPLLRVDGRDRPVHAADVHRRGAWMARPVLDRGRFRHPRDRRLPGRHVHPRPAPRAGIRRRARSGAATSPSGAHMSSPQGQSPITSTPVLRTTLVWSAVVTAALAVVGAVVGWLVAGADGLFSALAGI